eukprot:gene21097-23939_t
MPRKTIGSKAKAKDEFDYEPLVDPGITMLKFGQGGTPHERLFKLSGDLRYLSWSAGWFSAKLGGKCQVDLEKVIRVMQGQNTFQFQRYSQIYGDANEKSFSIVYQDSDGKEKTLDLIAPSQDIFKLWHDGLKALVQKLKEQRDNYSLDALFLKSLWDRADTDHSGTLNAKEIVRLVQSINVHLPTPTVKVLFKKYDVDNSGTLDFAEFVEFMTFLRKRPDLESVWGSIATDSPLPEGSAPLTIDPEYFPSRDAVISLPKFIKFWESVQGEKLSLEDARDLVEFCNSSTSESKATKKSTRAARHRDDLHTPNDVSGGDEFLVSYTMFSNVLSNFTKASLFDQSKVVEYQDMTHPLTYYYMASSHNTYLEGDQLTSFSSVNRYVNDLLLGCRCVELDCWDGDNGQPIICHGHTMTGKILFRDVIRAIAEYGFVTSPYPVVLSIENHCCLEQQKVLAKIMIDIFKDKLAMPLRNTDGSFVTTLPSPMELKHKVLIKGKRLATHGAEAEDADDPEDDDEEAEDPSLKGSTKEGIKDAPKKKKGSSNKTHPDLSNITYLGTGKVKSFSAAVSNSIPADMMASYAEVKTIKTIKLPDKVAGWIDHNKNHLSRIYPKGTRIDSSNYVPVGPWAAGNQLVALNYQTGDLAYHINFGKFLENGSTGYVLKPDYMIYNGVSEPTEGYRLVINVISACHLPKPGGAQKGEIIDPFVAVYLHGPSPADTFEARTRTIHDNGFNPVWNQTFTFDVRRPDLSYLTFHVNDEDVLRSDFVAFTSLPLACIRTGLRTLHLRNAVGKRDQDFEYASLFVR